MKMIVIASIHQPTTATFNLFSQLVLLSAGKLVYSGPTDQVVPYFATQGVPIPPMTNPAEFLLDVCNTDFDNSAIDVAGDESRIARLNRLMDAWSPKGSATEVSSTPFADSEGALSTSGAPTSVLWQTFVLLQRLWLKSYRDLLAYWIRVIMYLGMFTCSHSVHKLFYFYVLLIVRNRPGIHDGHSLAPSRERTGQHPTLHQRDILLRGIHVVYGGGLHPSIPRRPREFPQRAGKRIIRAYSVLTI